MANDKDLTNKVGGRTLFLTSSFYYAGYIHGQSQTTEDIPYHFLTMCSYLMMVGKGMKKNRGRYARLVWNIDPPIRMALAPDETIISSIGEHKYL